MSIRQEAVFLAPPQCVYELLTDSEKFAAATGKPARINAGEGATFSIFGDRMEGRHIELIPGQRVVQAWRSSNWKPGVFSVVKFTLTPEAGGTRVVLDQEAYPQGKSPMFETWHEHLSTGWKLFYFEPFARYLAGQSANEKASSN